MLIHSSLFFSFFIAKKNVAILWFSIVQVLCNNFTASNKKAFLHFLHTFITYLVLLNFCVFSHCKVVLKRKKTSIDQKILFFIRTKKSSPHFIIKEEICGEFCN